MATTASLESKNPYAKFRLKRRPTYEEITTLIGENDVITGKLPNRDATFLKNKSARQFWGWKRPFRIIERPRDENIRQADERSNDETGSAQKRAHLCSA